MNEQAFENFIEKYEKEIQLSAERVGLSVDEFKDKLKVIYVLKCTLCKGHFKKG